MRNTILIVEDDEMVRQGIVDALENGCGSNLRRGREKDKRGYIYAVYSGYEASGWQRDFSLPENQNRYGKSGFVPISV